MGIIDWLYRIFDFGLTDFENTVLHDLTKFLRGRNLEIIVNQIKVLNRVSRIERDEEAIRVCLFQYRWFRRTKVFPERFNFQEVFCLGKLIYEHSGGRIQVDFHSVKGVLICFDIIAANEIFEPNSPNYEVSYVPGNFDPNIDW